MKHRFPIPGAGSLVLVLVCGAALAQTGVKTAAPKLTGFPFQDESLHYSIRWPSGLPLGDVGFTAHHVVSGWTFEATLDAGVPGFAMADKYRSSVTNELCSSSFDRTTSHGAKKTREKTTFDQSKRTAHRETVLPADGGRSDFDIQSCARDALAFVYYVRQEMGQGRVAPAQQVYFGSAYSVSLRYTGEMTIRVEDKQQVTDHVVASIKGPQAEVSVEIFFARDPARTPLMVKLPLGAGTFSMELVR
jgi:Protein of unknown function (DUF3108)